MINKYIEYIKKHYPSDRILALSILIEKGFSKEVQEALNIAGANPELVEDGIIGFNTLLAFEHVDLELFDELIQEVIIGTTKDSHEVSTTTLKNFLYTWEGHTIHYNKGEKSPTTPMGVYCYAHPTCKPCKTLRSLYSKYEFDFKKRTHARKLNKAITREERDVLLNEVMEYYTSSYLKDVYKILIPYPKTSLSYASIAINGGRPRGIKAVQTVIGAVVDGKFGRNTETKLLEYLGLPSTTDTGFNVGLLDYMALFYCTLVTNNFAKFGRYLKGWFNRIKATGFKGEPNCETRTRRRKK